MHIAFALGALFCAPAQVGVSTPALSIEQRDQGEPVLVALEHGGDLALRDKLVRAFEVWHDAGDFLVARVPAGRFAGLLAREIGVTPLAGVVPDDELYVVDLTSEHALEHLAGARVIYRHERQGVAAVAPLTDEDEPGLALRHTCHSGHAAIDKRRIEPTRRVDPTAFGSAKLAAADPRIQALVSQVAKANISSHVNALAAITPNRDSVVAANIDQGRNYIANQLTALGYPAPTFQQFSTQHGDNVVLNITGTTLPNERVVIGAHYDSRNYNGGTGAIAPGADDNASGSAAVLEIARVLKNAGPFERSIRLVWFAGEEYGLLGANYNAQQSVAQGEQIVAMLNMDMIAYRATGDVRDCDFATNSTNSALTAFCRQTAPLYVPNWADTQGVLSAGSSDHAAYNSAGIPAAFFFEDLTQFFGQIHTSNDKVPTSVTDFDLAAMICQGVLACAATIAEPLDLQIAHVALADTSDATGPYAIDAQISSSIGSNVVSANVWYSIDGGQSWVSTPMSLSGPSWTGYIASQGSPQTYDYYIEAFDDQGNREVAPDGADGNGGAPYDFFVGTKTVVYSTSFEEANDNGWTHAQVATQDDWQRGVPQGKAGDPTAAATGTRVWANDLGGSGFNGEYGSNVNNYLRSPVIDCSSAINVYLEFERWLTVESAGFDQAQVKVNGTVVWSNPQLFDQIDTSWVPMSIDVSALAAGNPSVQVEFRLITDGGVSFGGWNIDDFALVETGPGTGGCPQATVYCTSKLNSQLCSPVIASTGQPSVSVPIPFDITCSQVVNAKNGLLFYGLQQSGAAFQGGHLCVKLPITRTTVQNSGGSTPPTADCSGSFNFDFNAWIQGGSDPALINGASVFSQYWYRDPQDLAGFQTGLSDALQFQICP